ncbi:MAG: replication-associated recombination protein A [Planctomycetes bacterium]|nr:replication-associated recombination protein A [Planctomycetota bacterium]
MSRSLFDPIPAAPLRPPLAERMRPRTLSEVVGQEQVTGPEGFLAGCLARKQLPSLILWGPPGCGKTTLARLLARDLEQPFVAFSAVLGGVKQVREIVSAARDTERLDGKGTVLFVDEIHRFNRSQQDAFLPHVESGLIVLVGATTENPSFEVNAALLSRARVVVLEPIGEAPLRALVERAATDSERGLGLEIDPQAVEWVARAAQGDARRALNVLETAASLADERILPAHVERCLAGSGVRYDKAGDQHYDTVSAFIKSLRGSDPDAAIYYLACMLEGGEPPRFVARRMVIFASEDVGNADPMALEVALNVMRAVEFVGLPEARINLAQGVAYLALAPKSNASYAAINAALASVRERGALPVPAHLRNAPTKLMRELGHGEGYAYAHDSADGVNAQRHMPAELGDVRFYEPSARGFEVQLRQRLDALRALRGGDDPA